MALDLTTLVEILAVLVALGVGADVDDVVIAQHARAHIMMLIGGCLM